ncbi:class I SAM-dependent methyltransferase [Pseudomonadales bacterium]|jgi:SAM-dependent methyltransferase|nr:class I SAM-dependent methyltransferase [Pseudomonadales bacterium]
MNNRNLDDYESKYIDKDHYDFEKFQIEFRRRNTLTLLNKNIHESILDIGCGMEPLFGYIDDYTSYAVVEPSDRFYDVAETLASGDKRISLFHDYIENIAVDVKYDFIIVSSLLHEVEDPEFILNAIKKLCHAKSVVYINVPNAKSFHRLLALEAGIISSIYSKSDNQIKFQQTHTYNLQKLEDLVIGSGYAVIESGSYFIKPFSHSQMRMLLANNVVSTEVLEGLENMIKYCPDLGSEIFLTCKLI